MARTLARTLAITMTLIKTPHFLSSLVPPSLTARAGDQALVEGDPATFTLSCSASGEPTPNITWTKVLEIGSDSEVLFYETPSSPFERSNNRSNEGTYRCTADNGIGSPVNHTASLTINGEYLLS